MRGLFAKQPHERDCILHNKPVILRSLLIVATPYSYSFSDIHNPPMQIFTFRLTSLFYRYSHPTHTYIPLLHIFTSHSYLHPSSTDIYIPPQQIFTSLSYVHPSSIDVYIALKFTSLPYRYSHHSHMHIPPLQIFTSL